MYLLQIKRIEKHKVIRKINTRVPEKCTYLQSQSICTWFPPPSDPDLNAAWQACRGEGAELIPRTAAVAVMESIWGQVKSAAALRRRRRRRRGSNAADLAPFTSGHTWPGRPHSDRPRPPLLRLRRRRPSPLQTCDILLLQGGLWWSWLRLHPLRHLAQYLGR